MNKFIGCFLIKTFYYLHFNIAGVIILFYRNSHHYRHLFRTAAKTLFASFTDATKISVIHFDQAGKFILTVSVRSQALRILWEIAQAVW